MCPVGHWCNPREDPTDIPQNQAHTNVQKCPSLSSTRLPGAHTQTQCVCVVGAYAVPDLEPTENTTTPVRCDSCLQNHYCTTQDTVPTACPRKTVSNRGSTSVNDCVCLPPMTMLPATDEDIIYDCVMTSDSLSHMEASVYVDTQHYDMYSIQADMLYSIYDTAQNSNCVSIHNGQFAFESPITFIILSLTIYYSLPYHSLFSALHFIILFTTASSV